MSNNMDIVSTAAQKKNGTFYVTTPTGKLVKFKPSPSKLHCHDARESAITVLNIIEENEAPHSARERNRALQARRSCHVMMHPLVNDCEMSVKSNAIRNCPVARRDIEVAEDIWGPALQPLKGKTTRKKPMVVKHDCVAMPKHVQEKHKDVILSDDAFHVQGLPFFITVSQNTLFATTEMLKN